MLLLFSCSVMSYSATPWTVAQHASLFFTISWSLLKLMPIESVMPSNHLILSSPSPSAFNLSQHQGHFQWVASLHQVAKVLEFQFQHQSFQCIYRVDFLQDWLVWSPCCPRDSREFSPASQFKDINSLLLKPFLLSSSHIHTWLLEKPSSDYADLCRQSNVSAF